MDEDGEFELSVGVDCECGRLGWRVVVAVAEDAVVEELPGLPSMGLSVLVEKLVGRTESVICAPACDAMIGSSLPGPRPRYGSA